MWKGQEEVQPTATTGQEKRPGGAIPPPPKEIVGTPTARPLDDASAPVAEFAGATLSLFVSPTMTQISSLPVAAAAEQEHELKPRRSDAPRNIRP